MAADKKHRDEQELERYGVWVKAGPDEINEHDSQSLELMDIEDSDSDELLITEEEEKLLGELEESALPDFSEFEESFDDSMDAGGLDDDFSIPSEESIVDDPESRDLLHKIEDDLSALREEIRQLKEELTGLRVPSVPPAPADAGDAGGFFEDEEDETIALTGDELDNILDSADMTEKSADEPDIIDEPEPEDAGISFDDEESIDLSGDFPEIASDDIDDSNDFDDFLVEDLPDEEDPAFAILGSPDEPEDGGDPETIEIDIPGLDETIDLDETEVVSIDEIGDEPEVLDEFEEITDLDDFGLDTEETLSIQDFGETEEPDTEEIIIETGGEVVLSEDFDMESFDEGEEVEIDLTVNEDILEASDDADMLGMDMEEISLDDFGLSEEESSDTSDTDEDSDVLSVGDSDEIEEINLADFELDDETDEDIEEIELDSVLAEGIEEGLGSIEEPVALEAGEDLIVEEIDLEAIEPEDSIEETGEVELELEEISLENDLIIEDTDISFEDLEEVPPAGDDNEPVFEDLEELEEIEILDDVVLEDEITLENDIPEISIDDAIEEIDIVDEFSLEEEDGELIEDLEIEIEEDDSIQVTLPDDDFNELPGTEEVDLTSLEALAAAPDLTEDPEEDIIELPDIDFDDDAVLDLAEVEPEEVEPDEVIEEITEFDLGEELEEENAPDPLVPTPRTIAEKAKAALEIDSLPGELKDEIKEVLKYMDQLLESLPDDKIQEFARSEHFEVYKKIFEELGISD